MKNDDVIDDIIGAISDTDDDELSDSDTVTEEYMVERILDKRRSTNGEVEYLVKVCLYQHQYPPHFTFLLRKCTMIIPLGRDE